MRTRLLLILLVALAGLGADCGGGSHGDSPAASSTGTSVATAAQGGNQFVPPIPEPSAVLVFGVGLLIAGAATRLNR